jgi:hypothetical protein
MLPDYPVNGGYVFDSTYHQEPGKAGNVLFHGGPFGIFQPGKIQEPFDHCRFFRGESCPKQIVHLPGIQGLEGKDTSLSA